MVAGVLNALLAPLGVAAQRRHVMDDQALAPGADAVQ
jgi:hypothetical protein